MCLDFNQILRSTAMHALLATVALLGIGVAQGAEPDQTGELPGTATPAATAERAMGQLEEITVTAARLDLIGTASTASEGVVVNDELALTPAYRPGQLLETVPGLVVTIHSGEGKANQYLLRGFNLDHGTDLATFVDEVPVNQVTHAHGNGYTDMNFLIPELATNIHFTKGTYYATEGDFASVGAIHVSYVDTIADQIDVSGGSWGFERVFSAGSTAVGSGNLLGAMELQHYDGPWVTAGDQRKENVVLRYSEGSVQDGYSLTASLYHGLWNAQTDQPERAVNAALISPFGELDTSDRGAAQRINLSGQFASTAGGGELHASFYGFSNHLVLINDFTHFLIDPVNGDQEEQHESRLTAGGVISYTHDAHALGLEHELLAGLQERYDFNDVGRLPSRRGVPIPPADNPLGFGESDTVHLSSTGIYLQATTHWTYWLRSVLGVREDYQHGSDAGTNPGAASAALFEPKASLIVTPVDTVEFYLSAGRGFHSNDLRGVNQARASALPDSNLISSETGEEVGLRGELFNHRVAATFALFNLDAQSQTTYNPDAGQDTAGPGSRRIGYELNITYQARRWLEFYGTISQDRARFKTPYDDGTGHLGEYLPNAPFATGSLSIYVKNLGPWSAGLQYRYLGGFRLSSGPCVDSAAQADFPGVASCAGAPTPRGQVNGSGYGEWNGDAHYAFGGGWSMALGVYNLLNTRADAIQYWYVDRLAGEPASGVADVHVHPLEPISLRLTLSKRY